MNIVSTMIEPRIFRESENGIQFLLLKRSEGKPYPGLWQMVTGKIKANEKAHQTAIRESFKAIFMEFHLTYHPVKSERIDKDECDPFRK